MMRAIIFLRVDCKQMVHLLLELDAAVVGAGNARKNSVVNTLILQQV
jgi:hypothetical protein